MNRRGFLGRLVRSFVGIATVGLLPRPPRVQPLPPRPHPLPPITWVPRLPRDDANPVYGLNWGKIVIHHWNGERWVEGEAGQFERIET